MGAQEDREAHELLHDIDNPVIVARRLHPACLVELLVGLGDARLVGDGEHPHPAAEHAQSVDGVERLRTGADLHDCKRSALCRAQSLVGKRQVVDLRLHDTGNLAVAFRAAPDLPFRPERVFAKLLHRGMVVT